MGINRSDGGKINFDEALEIFLAKFVDLHPKSTWPEWMKKCTNYGGKKEENDFWRISFSALPQYKLKENEEWEIAEDGTKSLIRVDPETGEKGYIISNTATEVIIIFEAIVNPYTSEISVIIDMDLESIDGNTLQKLRE